MQLPDREHPTDWHFNGKTKGAAPVANFVQDRTIYVADAPYDAYRSMLYALGAKGVTNKLMANVDTIVHGAAVPKAAKTKYPNGQFIKAQTVLPLFHQEVASFSDYVRALIKHGFRVRNPSDEGDPEFDHFSLPLANGSLHATLRRYLDTSPFIRDFSSHDSPEFDRREESYVPVPIPGTDRTWWIRWDSTAWDRVSAQRGEGDYPLEIKGPQLLAVAPAVWTRSTGLYFHRAPHIDSVNGLFIQAGINARTGQVDGVSISRVWT
jgi:hypothetical protein